MEMLDNIAGAVNNEKVYLTPAELILKQLEEEN